MQLWKGFDDSLEVSALVNDLPTVDVDMIKWKLSQRDIGFVAKRDIPEGQQTVAYFTAKTITNETYLIELKFKVGMNISKVTVKSPNKVRSDFVKTAVSKILQSA